MNMKNKFIQFTEFKKVKNSNLGVTEIYQIFDGIFHIINNC